MDAKAKAPPTSVGDETEVSRNSIDRTAQNAIGQAKESSRTPPIVQSTNKSSTPSEHGPSLLQPQIDQRPQEDEITDDDDNSRTIGRKAPRPPKFESQYPEMKRVSPWEVNVPPRPPTRRTEARVTHMGNLEFRQKHTFSAIEVLLEEPQVTMSSRQKSHSSRDLALQFTDPSQVRPITKSNPKKIRICSPIILEMLGDVAKTKGHSFTTNNGQLADITVPVVFIHPFKLFARLEPDIRTKVAELEAKVEETEIEAAKRTQGEDESIGPDNASRPCRECGHKPSLLAITEREMTGTPEPNIHGNLYPQPPPALFPSQKVPTRAEQLQHLKMLIDVFDSDLKPMFDLRRDIRDGILTHIAFQDLWHLFQFGQDVITNGNESQVYRVIRWTGGRPHYGPPPPPPPPFPSAQYAKAEAYSGNFKVDCVYLDFDGHLYTTGYERFIIRKFEGEKAIISLQVFPIVFLPNHVKLHKQLTSRGDTWLQLTQPDQSVHKHYTGLTLDLPQAYEIDSQVIVDAKMAILRHFDSPVPTTEANQLDHNYGETVDDQGHNNVHDVDMDMDMNIHSDYGWDMQYEQAYFRVHKSWRASTTDAKEIEDEDKILLPPYVLGFVLRSRKWARFNVDLIEPVRYTSGFDALVLPDGHKDTVRALVATHARTPTMSKKGSQTEHSIDLVRGKGEGLVILLHGAPGVGKTSTAECVADNTQRPLFPITCGDIGDTATDVEENLESSFQLAHRWGCVLLLDEADIFLSKRDKVDIKRNAIVSVFLRTLEYYRGILFLTTNRVGTFDPAFRSRIHVSLYYPPLKKDATMQIWKMHLRRTQAIKCHDEQVDFRINSKEILKFAKEHYYDLKKNGAGSWNGRQIRNAFQTAIALAEFHAAESHPSKPTNLKIELGKKHFLTVAQASKDFDDYLQRTLGGQNEADMARNEQTRIDDFDMPKVVRRGQGKKKKVVENVESEESEEDSEDSDAEEGSEDGSEEEVEVVQVVKKVVKKRLK